MPTSNIPSIANLKRAIEVAEQIEKLQSLLASLVGGAASVAAAPKNASPAPAKRGGKRNMSPEARERIAAAQRARWAKSKGAATSANKSAAADSAKPSVAPKAAKKAKRNISPEARAKMAAAAKRRWAKVKK